MKCQIKSAFFPFTLHLAYNSIKIIERNPTLSDSFPCEQAFGCWRLFSSSLSGGSEEEKASSRARLRKGWLYATTSRGLDGRKEKGKKKIEGCKDVTLLGKDTN